MYEEHDIDDAGIVYEPCIYREDFEAGELNGWASYPPCQDTAYNPYVYPGKIRPEDANTCFVAVEEVHWHEDQFLGGVKLLDLALDRSFRLKFSYYLKTLDSPARLEVHFPLATGERAVYTLDNPPANAWFGVELGWRELEKHNLFLLQRERVRITALAVQARVAKADPDMKIYLGIDDIELSALREVQFSFVEPEVAELSEWKERIPLRHYHPGGELEIAGTLGFEPEKVMLEITPFAERKKTVAGASLSLSEDGVWRSGPIPLDDAFPPGLYHGRITASTDGAVRSRTYFTFFVVRKGTGGRHPRLLFDERNVGKIKERFNSERFSGVREVFEKEAESYRKKVPVERVVYDFDQFPVKDWIPTIWYWFVGRIMNFREALFTNAVVYAMLDDCEAGRYCRDVMLRLAEFPMWNHPWMEARGLHSYFPAGEMAEAYSLAYDLIYGMLTEDERRVMEKGVLENYIEPAFRTFVEQNRITVNSSNWISHINGGALMALTALYGEDRDAGDLEPWLTGFILKEYRYISVVFGRDGSYGEGFRYYNFAMQSFAKVIPMLDRVFGLDLGAPIERSYLETLWAGIPQEDKIFTFGDSQGYIRGESQAYWIGGHNGPMNNWAWLVARTRDPRLSWLYHTLKSYDTFEEILHETGDVPQESPDSLGETAFFRDVGTAVFKSGWGSEDFVFVFRSGPFYNHQHMDQGSFFLADHGRVFLEERYDGDHHYYDDPLYQGYAIRTISHNTILINGNPQSQEVGDPKDFAPGMNDHAQLVSWLDCGPFAFAEGRLDGVYRGAVKELRRYVFFVKPRSILMVDRVVPGEEDVEVDLLFHTEWKKDITCAGEWTEFHKDGAVLYMYHLAPEGVEREIKGEPHFLCQYGDPPLIERGYLRLSSETAGAALVAANFMTAVRDGSPPDVKRIRGEGWVGTEANVGEVNASCMVNTSGDTLDYGDCETDALIVARTDGGEGVFVADATRLSCGEIVFEAENGITAYISRDRSVARMVYHLPADSRVSFVSPAPPGKVLIDGKPADVFDYDEKASLVTVRLPGGDGNLEIFK